MRFYVFSPRFFIRPKNTDWLYNRMLPQVRDFTDDFEIYLQQAIVPSLITNIRLAAQIAHNRLKTPLPRLLEPRHEDRFSIKDLRRSRADVIYGHSPTNVSNMPLIYHTGPIYEQELRTRGVPEQIIAAEKAVKLKAILRSHLVTVNTEIGAETLRALHPPSASKIMSIPFFLPHIQPIPADQLAYKWSNRGKIKLLFVGREANRKGLPAVLQAFRAADARHPGLLELLVITNFADGPVDIPAMPNLTVKDQMGREEVGALMKESHVLLMPSRFETYGWVYLEAMAAGAVTMACDAPAQQEILAGGTAGLLVQSTAQSVTESLLKLLARSHSEMGALARQGWQRVQDVYSPSIVAGKMKQLGHEAKERFRADLR